MPDKLLGHVVHFGHSKYGSSWKSQAALFCLYSGAANLFAGTTPMNLTTDLIVSNITFSGTTNISNYVSINSSTLLGSGSGSGTFALVE